MEASFDSVARTSSNRLSTPFCSRGPRTSRGKSVLSVARRRWQILIAAIWLLVSGSQISIAQEVATDFSVDPELPYLAAKSNDVTYQVDFSVVVTPPYKAKKLSVWLPIPPSDSAQQVLDSKLTAFPMQVEPTISAEEKFGNRFAYFEFANPQGAQIIRHQFTIRVSQLNWNIDPSKVSEVPEWPKSFDRYRQGDTQAVVQDERFTNLLTEIVPERKESFGDFGSVMSWVQKNATYDHNDASLQADATHLLEKRRGHCSDYHSFCASLGRELGVPTRVTYGINPFPKNSPSHCKLEAFIAPYGWVSFDVSETQKLVSEIQKNTELSQAQKESLSKAAFERLMSGFRDNTWFLQTRGTDYELAPKGSRRVPVVRTAYIEADGVPLAEPDPANKEQHAFTWMTVHEYKPDRVVPYPFSDWTTLNSESSDSKTSK